ncbi:Pantoate-beta-alanine ligase [Amanita rubescens]|nr:Pantoate-beta-alanine ligase [Amanita rubescens]
MSASASQQLPQSRIPIITTVSSYREWRSSAFRAGQSVGFVPTMGALHEGHLSLVRRSLAANDHTVVSIFVNPAQFAPHEDLATYPRTLARDAEILSAESVDRPGHPQPSTVSVIFAPNAREMYPSGYDHQMEGKSRPTFFRGVATVVTKLFNIIQPTNAYFGQKDIQQALILRRLCRDLLLAHPEPDHLHIIPTTRDPTDGLALSSRNMYLSTAERRFAPTLYEALLLVERAWNQGRTTSESIEEAIQLIQSRVRAANESLERVGMKLDYMEMNDAETFDKLEDARTKSEEDDIIISGALWIGKTRLIDNILIGVKR